ncbi:MAG: hypothetical protein IPG59_00065 [Candidatus Melainabacteria bacterium]|nr:MAG: hypothetical protein IPG59_00065 [Candidatus Melainabacteria bacterium]
MPMFKSGFEDGGFCKIEMIEGGKFLAFLTADGGKSTFAKYEFAIDSEYAKYLESKVGKMKPGDIITFVENPAWKPGQYVAYLPRRVIAKEQS